MSEQFSQILDKPTHIGEDNVPSLLQVSNLRVEFNISGRIVCAVNGISYNLRAGTTLAIVGESGSGKSVSVRAIMGLIPNPPGKVVGGRVLFHGHDLLKMPAEEIRRLRGRRIAMVPQDPLTALNPTFPIGWQINEVFRVHEGISNKRATKKAIELMERVGIPDAARRVNDYPFQFSGGMRQRVLIAMALALKPELLIADEPTTALDVTTQAQILDLLTELKKEYGMGLLLITHNLGIVAEIADQVAIMYAGYIMEMGQAENILRWPGHPYTLGLKNRYPIYDSDVEKLLPIPGSPPTLWCIPPGCPFHPRCSLSNKGVCNQELPQLRPLNGSFCLLSFCREGITCQPRGNSN
jgi:oligopeptide transport system ATP-binding protein